MNRLLTILARPSRSRRTLPLLFSALLAFAASCGTEFKNCPDCPGTPALIPGKFVLAAVDAKVLPHTLADSSLTFISGDCTTTSDDKFTLSLTTVAKGKTDTLTANTTGFVLPYNKGTVTFNFSASSVQAQALITGNGFTLQYNTVTLLFERIG